MSAARLRVGGRLGRPSDSGQSQETQRSSPAVPGTGREGGRTPGFPAVSAPLLEPLH